MLQNLAAGHREFKLPVAGITRLGAPGCERRRLNLATDALRSRTITRTEHASAPRLDYLETTLN